MRDQTSERRSTQRRSINWAPHQLSAASTERHDNWAPLQLSAYVNSAPKIQISTQRRINSAPIFFVALTTHCFFFATQHDFWRGKQEYNVEVCMYEVWSMRDKDLQWHIEMMICILKIVKESDPHFVNLTLTLWIWPSLCESDPHYVNLTLTLWIWPSLCEG